MADLIGNHLDAGATADIAGKVAIAHNADCPALRNAPGIVGRFHFVLKIPRLGHLPISFRRLRLARFPFGLGLFLGFRRHGWPASRAGTSRAHNFGGEIVLAQVRDPRPAFALRLQAPDAFQGRLSFPALFPPEIILDHKLDAVAGETAWPWHSGTCCAPASPCFPCLHRSRALDVQPPVHKFGSIQFVDRIVGLTVRDLDEGETALASLGLLRPDHKVKDGITSVPEELAKGLFGRVKVNVRNKELHFGFLQRATRA
jgi:hypothetical protein